MFNLALILAGRTRSRTGHPPDRDGHARNLATHYSGGPRDRHHPLLVHLQEGRLLALAFAAEHHSAGQPGSDLRAGLLRSGRWCPPRRRYWQQPPYPPRRLFRRRAERGLTMHSIVRGKQLDTMPESTPSAATLLASVLPPRPPAFCTSAAPAPLSSIGSMPATTTAPWCCAWTTPMSSATPTPASNPSSRGCAGWASTGTKSTSNPNALPCTASRPRPSSPRALPIATSRPPTRGDDNQSSAQGAWLFNPGMRELSREESDRRAAAGEPFALRYRVPRGEGRTLRFVDGVYGAQSKARRRGGRLRPAALGRNAHLPPGLVRRRRRSPHQPHHSRPGSPHQHLQAPAHL